MENYMLPCLNKALFGMDCYGCGMQRSFVFLIQGKFQEAFHMYPPIYFIIPLLALIIFNLFHKFKNDYKIKMGFVMLTATAVFVNYGIKLYHFFNLI